MVEKLNKATNIASRTSIRFFLTALIAALAFSSKGEVFEGVVTIARGGDSYFFMTTPSGSVWRVQGKWDKRDWERGDIVRVEGDRITHSNTPRVRMKSIKLIGTGTLPDPLELTVKDMTEDLSMGGKTDRLFGRLVTVDGRVRDINRRQTFAQLTVGDEDYKIIVVIPLRLEKPLTDGLAVGSKVRSTGVVVYVEARDELTHNPIGLESVSVLVQDMEGIAVLNRPPFWTVGRLLFVILVFAVIALMFIVWSILLRRAVKRQTHRLGDAIRARVRERVANEATRRERLRLSRDLHDEFQQILSGAQYLAGTALAALPKDAALEGVSKLLRKTTSSIAYAQSQLRVILWGLTQVSEGPASLVELLKYVVERNPSWKEAVEVSSEGEEQPIVRSKAGELLMIMQEATGNAFNHGFAMTVRVHVSFGEKSLVMRISDDGTGFDLAAEIPSGHYGLASMRERADELGGSLSIESKMGEGTSIIVEVPYE